MTTVLQSLNDALLRAFADDETVLLIGEDVLDPYGGAFKVTRGLSSTYPDRVLTSPISEAGIIGLATGMALRGLRPVVEIMFGDFVTLIADQIINHAAKFRWMYNDGQPPYEQSVQVPLVIRTPMGGRRGYGPTHSQTLEKLFLGVPGLRVLAPNAVSDPGKLLYDAISTTSDPVLFVENKLLYLLPVADVEQLAEFNLEELPSGSHTPTHRLTLRGAPPATITLAAYGYMAELTRQAMLTLAYEHEIFTELLIPTDISKFQPAPSTSCLVTVEEGTLASGWGAEMIARAKLSMGACLKAVDRVTALDSPIPASAPLEEAILPDVEKIIQAARKMV